ncbi:PREDICTED: eukaryotic translation initiation factor 4B3 [Nicotiana attenuata]|uniref:Eukaryotic translation initiation factor 4b3 n=1 Tax=Nicotiana attenuata TaxID=49451 RepID=A0A1J6LAF1_NICAT|nr:PREDICTED: eukaryotic translation initiation factor 4B3 [Nicotiana attenuata]OIT28017.1 eukaryotic translation initiation factor 4b3 [Nicotiana attenuata]
MAATVSAWGKPGAWALDSEEHESELQKEESVNGDNHSNGAAAGLSDFPSLAAAATTKTKKKKPQTLSLQEFSTYSSVKKSQSAAAAAVKGLTPEEVMMLPTGPRERSAEELDSSRLGGGFRSYGYDRQGGRGSSDESRRPGGFRRDSDREIAPSRADETDDWGAAKKTSIGNSFDRRERGERGGFFSDSHSKADESDNWGANKSFVPSSGRRFDRRGSFGSNGSDSDSDKWTKRSGGGGAFDSLRERRGGGYESNNSGVDSENWGRGKREETLGGGGGGGRPKLNLQPRTLPIAEVQQQNGGNNEATVVVKPKGSNNPFGAARPREEVLKEKGQDWKEIDQKLESLKVKEVVSESSDKKAWGNGKPSFMREERTEKSWRKPEPNEVRPLSAEETVNGAVEETGQGAAEESGGEPQI